MDTLACHKNQVVLYSMLMTGMVRDLTRERGEEAQRQRKISEGTVLIDNLLHSFVAYVCNLAVEIILEKLLS